jgi:putative transcriptional regulator
MPRFLLLAAQPLTSAANRRRKCEFKRANVAAGDAADLRILNEVLNISTVERRMKRKSITRFKLNPKKPPKSDWRDFDAMSEEARHRAAVSDPDALPATEAQLARARRVPTVRALRKKLNLTQEQFSARFHLPLGTVRDWEQGAHRPDKAAQVLLTVIAKDPDAVARALKS